MARKIISKALELLIRAAIAVSATVPLAKALIDAAFRERGYSAVGGEWMLIIIIAAALWKLSGYLIEPPKKERKVHRENSDNR